MNADYLDALGFSMKARQEVVNRGNEVHERLHKIITTVNDFDWTVKYKSAIVHGTLNTVQKINVVKFLINLDNITDI